MTIETGVVAVEAQIEVEVSAGSDGVASAAHALYHTFEIEQGRPIGST